MPVTRVASYNVENMFDRAKAMNRETWEQSGPLLGAHARLNELIQRDVYDQTVKDEMLALLDKLGLLHSDMATYAILRRIRGRFLARPRTGDPYISAQGRESWIGWVELTTEHVTALASRHTAMVMRDVGADVLGVVEAESRTLLEVFSASMLPDVGWTPYEQALLLDGNDGRGIDVGLMTRGGHRVTEIRTHIADTDRAGVIFSRDCPEYHVRTPGGERLVVLVNHFKSKGYGSAEDPIGAERRFRQAARLAQIYADLVYEGARYVAVAGDLNDDASSEALAPLFERTPLRDISEHPDFAWGPRRGTFGSGNDMEKIDYVLLSPELFTKATGGGVFRKGIWRGSRTRDPWEIYDTMTAEHHAASDHGAIYADIDWAR